MMGFFVLRRSSRPNSSALGSITKVSTGRWTSTSSEEPQSSESSFGSTHIPSETTMRKWLNSESNSRFVAPQRHSQSAYTYGQLSPHSGVLRACRPTVQQSNPRICSTTGIGFQTVVTIVFVPDGVFRFLIFTSCWRWFQHHRISSRYL